jgi:PAS domain S-box-containing protein/putative nucleotidyltransferase with HDIG domain
MKKHSDSEDTKPVLRDKIIGLGERSIRKGYYPQLQKQLEELEAVREELAKSQARYRSLVENINDVIFSLDPEGIVTYISPVIQSLGGFTPEEVIGKSFREFIHPEDMPALEANFERILAGNLKPHEFRVRIKGGGYRYMRTSSRPLLEEGRVVGMTGVMSDITERKRTEKELLASEQLFRALVENSPDYIARYDREYHRTYVNPAIQRLFPVPTENVLGKTPADQSPIKAPQVYIDHLRQVIENASECILETPFRTAKGEMHWGQIRFVPEFDAEGKVVSVLTIGRDIHEIKESEQRSRRFIANLPAFFFTFRRTEDGRYCFPYSSPGIKTIYGLDPEDVREDMKALHMLAHPDDRSHIEAGIAESFKTLEPFRIEFRVCRPDMPERWVEARSVSHVEVDGSMLWYGIMLDITERKHAEERLRENLVGTIRAFSLTVEKRDPYTAGHQARVSRLCTVIGEKLGMDAERIEGLRLGALIHDIGNVYVPAEILSRPGKLKDLEFAIVKSHAQIGYEIVRDIKFPWPVADMILQHHERLDGSGYPKGVKAPEIILEARIIAVADVVEAMASHRPYREALGVGAAMQEIEANRGTKYDPEVVDVCLSLFRDGGFSFD